MRLARHHLNAALYLGVAVLSKGASVLLVPLYTRRLSRGEYADYGLCQTVFWIVPALVTLSLSTALARFYFDHADPRARARTVGGIAWSIIPLALAGGLCGELAVDVWRPHVGTLGPTHLRLVVWICTAIPVADIPGIWFRIGERAGRFAALNLSSFALTAAATVYFMLVRHRAVDGLLGGLLVGQGATALFAIAFAATALRARPSRRLLVEAARYSTPLIPHTVGNALMSGVDRWALELYGLRDDLGLYTLANQLCVPIQLAAAAWNEASSPTYLATFRDGGWPAARRRLPRITLGFVAASGGALLCVLAALPVLRPFVGERFRAAFWLVPWVGLSLVAGTLFAAFINVLYLRKDTRLIPVLTVASVLVNAALNVVLVPLLGVHGAILATGLAYGFRAALMLRFALRALDAGVAASRRLGEGHDAVAEAEATAEGRPAGGER